MSSQTIHLFDEYSLDLARGCLIRAHVPVHLRRQSYEVLKYLVENRGHLISKDKLIQEVWQGRAVTDGSLGKCIEEIRGALGADAARYVRNERGRGYILEAAVTKSRPLSVNSEQLDVVSVVVEDDDGDHDHGLSLSHLDRGSISSHAKRRTRQLVLVLSAITIAVAACALLYAKYSSTRSQQISSIAVLPFRNVTGDPKAEYLSDGLTESLIDQLAKMRDLKVIARSSSFTYKGREVDARDVARQLGVHGLVTGTVVKQGESLIVSAELVDARDRTRVWGEQYTGSISDFQQVQEQISRKITEKLRLRLSEPHVQQVTKVNSQAYQFYLNGRFHFNQGSYEDLRKSLEYFNQAVLLDPNFALAWAWVSRANNNLGGNSLLNPKDTQVKAKAAAERALELDETLADAHFALGRIKQDDWDWSGAEQEYKRALELSPSLAFAHAEYAQFLTVMTRHVEALSEIKRAQELDPMSVRLRRREAWLLHLARRSDEAIAVMSETLKEAHPPAHAHMDLGFMYESKGLHEKAIREFREAIAKNGESTSNLCYLAGALAVAGRKKETLEIVDRLTRSKEYVSPTELAAVYARLKDTEAAITMLQKAYDEKDIQLQILNVEPFFDYLRSDPRFQDILRRVGLPSSPNG